MDLDCFHDFGGCTSPCGYAVSWGGSRRAKLVTGFTDLIQSCYTKPILFTKLVEVKEISDCNKCYGWKPPAPLKCVINVISDTDCEQVVRGMCLRLCWQAYQPIASVYEESVCSPGEEHSEGSWLRFTHVIQLFSRTIVTLKC